ncbi:hypothetical protein EVAR_36183_1 [Eumeta japonica]|uniref:Uncharacterized protein n=1 Tax=Eumeta variegata TaxID=151549 RepID=A0A4C1VSW9_EUMVA|nr:hypothetical protein EVAR_36183_1 [Eumeta japonica]
MPPSSDGQIYRNLTTRQETVAIVYPVPLYRKLPTETPIVDIATQLADIFNPVKMIWAYLTFVGYVPSSISIKVNEPPKKEIVLKYCPLEDPDHTKERSPSPTDPTLRRQAALLINYLQPSEFLTFIIVIYNLLSSTCLSFFIDKHSRPSQFEFSLRWRGANIENFRRKLYASRRGVRKEEPRWRDTSVRGQLPRLCTLLLAFSTPTPAVQLYVQIMMAIFISSTLNGLNECHIRDLVNTTARQVSDS